MRSTGAGINSFKWLVWCVQTVRMVKKNTAHVRNRWNCPWQSLNKLPVLQMLLGVEKRRPQPPISHSFQCVLLTAFLILTFSSFYNLNLHSDTPTHPVVSVPPLLWKCFPQFILFSPTPRSLFYLSTSRLLFHHREFMSKLQGSIFSHKNIDFVHTVVISDFISCLTLSLLWRTLSKYKVVSLLFIETNVHKSA